METYKWGKCVGKGAYGAAYVVTHKQTRETFVVKKITMTDLPEDERKSTEQEVKLLRELGDHPNIVHYFDSFMAREDEDDVMCIVMTNCEGGDLEGQIKKKEKEKDFFEESRILDWHVQISLALLHMHDRNVLHRDLKTAVRPADKQQTTKLLRQPNV
jgi:NIMA (never in mitosis gene a)-related kinase